MKTNRAYLIATAISTGLFGVGVGLLLSLRSPLLLAKELIDEGLIAELKVFTDVLGIVQENYVKEVSGKDLTAGAIKGMMTALDPHSAYLDPDYFQDIQSQTKGEFGGLGIEITMKDGLLTVISPMEGTPAERAGIRSGDIIIKVDGEYLKEMPIADVIKKLRGPKGSKVVVSIMRKSQKGKIREYTLIRDQIMIRSVKSRYLGGGYGYVRIAQFMESTASDLEKELVKLNKQSHGLKGLVLDVRNNPGGLLTQAIAVADIFLHEGVVVSTKGRDSAKEQKFYAHSAGTEPEYPIVVLINGGSASASEIVSGALKDLGRGLIVGRQSFGKGSVQTINPLRNGGAVQLTTALYYTSSGRSIQALGVTPDIELPVEEEIEVSADKGKEHSLKNETVRESDLPGAFSNPTSIKEINKSGAKETQSSSQDEYIPDDKLDLASWLKRDNYARKALNILKKYETLNIPSNQFVVEMKKEKIQ